MSGLQSQKKFYNPEGRQLGCCICRLRNSSSVFTHSSKFTREEISDAFGLDSLGLHASRERFGYMCNPCRLATDRYLQAKKKASSSTSVPNLVERLDSKLHGSNKQTLTAPAVEVKEDEAGSDSRNRLSPVVEQETVTVPTRRPHVVYTGVKRHKSKKGSVTKDGPPVLSHSLGDSSSLCADRTVEGLREADKGILQEPTVQVNRVAAAIEPRRNRRVQRQPVRNLKPRQESFIDLTYFQQVQLPCGTVYMGEGGMVVIQADTFRQTCPQTTTKPTGDSKEESK